MIVSRISPFSGKLNRMELPITVEQYEKWTTGELLIQEAFPHLNPGEREFIMTGITPAEWDAMFRTEDLES